MSDRRRGAQALRVGIALALVGWGLGCQSLPGRGPARVSVSDGWLAMGTFFDADLRVSPDAAPAARSWLDEQRASLVRLEAIYSRHDPESEVSQLNARLDGAGAGALPVGTELATILEIGRAVWAQTGGAFEPTIGPLVTVWTEAGQTGRWPAVDRLRAAKARVGMDGLELAPGNLLQAKRAGLRLDLDGLSKGAALDELAASFRDRFPRGAALLSLGESSVVAIGDPEGRLFGGGWRLEAHSRAENAATLTTVELRDQALSVSSSLGRTSMIDGQRVSHVVDPRTGGALERSVEAVVVADRAGMADAWSTALLVLGADRDAMRLVERADIEAYVFEESGRIAASSGWESIEAPAAPSVESGPPLEEPGRQVRPD